MKAKQVKDPKQQTAVYLPESIRARIARYIADKHAGKLNVRNDIILRALDELLTKEGY